MKENQITVLMVEPGKNPALTTIENKLEKLQEAVSIGADYVGLIEIIGIDDGVSILCNEEAKLIGLEANRRFYEDVLCGVFYVVGDDEEGNLTSLSPEMQDKYSKFFWKPETINPDEISSNAFISFVEVD